MSKIQVLKLKGNELHRELIGPKGSLRVLKNQHTQDKYKVYDKKKDLLKEPVLFESPEEALEFAEELLIHKRLVKKPLKRCENGGYKWRNGNCYHGHDAKKHALRDAKIQQESRKLETYG